MCVLDFLYSTELPEHISKDTGDSEAVEELLNISTGLEWLNHSLSWLVYLLTKEPYIYAY